MGSFFLTLSKTGSLGVFFHEDFDSEPRIDEILELTGCDRLTISPGLIEQLKNSEGTVEKKLDAEKSQEMDIPKINVDEKTFRMMNAMDPMCTEKLAAGIRGFAADIEKLETIIKEKMDGQPDAKKAKTS